MKMKIKTENIPRKPVKNNQPGSSNTFSLRHFLHCEVALRHQFTSRLFSPPIPIGKNLKAIVFQFYCCDLHSPLQLEICRYTLFIFLVDFVNLTFDFHSNIWPMYCICSHRYFSISFLLWISLMS